jgi:hypothetical protein
MTKENKVEELKREFEEYVKSYNTYEYDVSKIFREWMFEKLAAMPEAAPNSIEAALEKSNRWRMTDEELEDLMR